MDDLISRQAAIDAADRADYTLLAIEDVKLVTDEVVKEIKKLPSAQPEIIRCKDCKHKPYPSDNYNFDNGDCGFEIIFPDYRCPCQCDDGYYNRIPDDDWFCGNAERRTDE